MYKVSNQYREAMKSQVQRFRLRGTIGGFPFNEKNIMDGSFSVANQCADSEEIGIGQVYVGELRATFRGVQAPRYAWHGMEIQSFVGMRLPDGSYEDIPLGVFDVSEAEWTSAGVAVTAYDHMARFDKAYSERQTAGTPYELTVLACEQCGVVFGMEKAAVAAMPNGDIALSVYAENDIETWRDYISWLAQTLGAFATMNREGKLVYRMYGGEPVDTIDNYHRFTGASFSDFVSRYTGMSVVNIRDSTTSYYSVSPDDGLTYNLGSNPFLQYGTKDMYEAHRMAVFEALQKINYMPFKVSAIGNPAYDLGDALVFTGGLADGSRQSCITQYVFTYDGKYEMKGVGKNPALASAKSKTEKNLSGLLSSIDSKELSVYSFINAEAKRLRDNEWVTIVAMEFAAISDKAKINIWTDMTLAVDLAAEQAVCEVAYYLDGQIQSYHPAETWGLSGAHHLALLYYVGDIMANTRYSWSVAVRLIGATGTVDAGNAHAMISGQGLASGEGWNHKEIKTEENVHPLEMKKGVIDVRQYSASPSIQTENPSRVSGITMGLGLALKKNRLLVNDAEIMVSTQQKNN